MVVLYGCMCYLSFDESFRYINMALIEKDLKSFSRQRECGFDSRPGHHVFNDLPTPASFRIAPNISLAPFLPLFAFPAGREADAEVLAGLRQVGPDHMDVDVLVDGRVGMAEQPGKHDNVMLLAVMRRCVCMAEPVV